MRLQSSLAQPRGGEATLVAGEICIGFVPFTGVIWAPCTLPSAVCTCNPKTSQGQWRCALQVCNPQMSVQWGEPSVKTKVDFPQLSPWLAEAQVQSFHTHTPPRLSPSWVGGRGKKERAWNVFPFSSLGSGRLCAHIMMSECSSHQNSQILGFFTTLTALLGRCIY